ncbi:hypothetical protein QVA66_09420 [Staphylococcus chromogenes]|nr:hypothetical protein [Staphylococcus chromogenes]
MKSVIRDTDIRNLDELCLEAEGALQQCARQEAHWRSLGLTDFFARLDILAIYSPLTSGWPMAVSPAFPSIAKGFEHQKRLASLAKSIPSIDPRDLEDFYPGHKTALEQIAEELNSAWYNPIVQIGSILLNDGSDKMLAHIPLIRRGIFTSPWFPITGHLHALLPHRPASVSQWYEAVFEATIQTAVAVQEIASRLEQQRQRNVEIYEHHRAVSGRQKVLREDSAEARILSKLPATPVLTHSLAVQEHGVSLSAAKRALEDLCAAGILSKGAPTKFGAKTYLATHVVSEYQHLQRTWPRPAPMVGKFSSVDVIS